MRSQYVDVFNHDQWAEDYDNNVNDAEDPIRQGYWETVHWVVEQAGAGSDDLVLDLGTGTGNTAGLLPNVRGLVCVDISRKMMAQARPKLEHYANVSYVVADLLEYWQLPGPTFDCVISTYAIHHLTSEEKGKLFDQLATRLSTGARVVFGDLMFESAQQQERFRSNYVSAGRQDVVEAIDEEWFWHIDVQQAQLLTAGLEVVNVEQLSDLSWGIAVRRPD